MSSFDRLLVPACTCGKKLTLWAPDTLPSQDVTHVRVYRCGDCDHETRITVWGADVHEDLVHQDLLHEDLRTA